MYRAVIVLLILLIPGSVLSQDIEPPEKVAITHTGTDIVGNTLAYTLREQVSESSQMELVEVKESDTAVIILNLKTIDAFEEVGDSGEATSYSIAWGFYLANNKNWTELLLGSTVGQCGKSQVEDCAKGLVANTNELRRNSIEKVRNLIQVIQTASDGGD